MPITATTEYRRLAADLEELRQRGELTDEQLDEGLELLADIEIAARGLDEWVCS